MKHDIITRLRALQMNTADEAAELIQRLTAERDEALSLFRTQQMTYITDIQLLTAERDAARREVCYASTQPPNECAEDRGWKCFKEEADICNKEFRNGNGDTRRINPLDTLANLDEELGLS